MRVRLVSGDGVGGGQILDARHDALLPLPEDQVGVDPAPAMVSFDEAVAVVYGEKVQRVLRVGMLRVKEQRSVGALRIEYVVLVQPGAVELAEVVLREVLAAVRAAGLPRMVHRVHLPGVHGDAGLADRAVAVRPDLPGPLDRVAEHQVPQLVVRALHPGLRRRDRLLLYLRRPRVFRRVRLRLLDQSRWIEHADSFRRAPKAFGAGAAAKARRQ